MTYTVLASNPETGEIGIGIASTTITINFGRTFPVFRHLEPEVTDRGIIVAPMATAAPQALCTSMDSPRKATVANKMTTLFTVFATACAVAVTSPSTR